MKYKSISFSIIFTLLFLILSGLFLIYIFWNIQNKDKECFTEGSAYSWKEGEGNSCGGTLNTNTELMDRNSQFLTMKYNRFDNNRFYKKDSLRDPSHPYNNYCDVMTYAELLAYRCLNKSPMELRTIFESSAVNIASTIDYVYIYNDISLKSFILSKIQSTKATLGTKVVGPVYACISQAPYLRSVSNKIGVNSLDTWNAAREDIANQKNPYYFDKESSTGVKTVVESTSDGTDTFATTQTISSLYCHILIVYPAYTKAYVLKEPVITKQPVVITNFLEKTMANHYTDHGLCFIKCNKSTDLNCGCLSRTEAVSVKSPAATLNWFYENIVGGAAGASVDARDKPLYKSSCLDHTKNNLESNFTMMYYVNPYSAEYGDKNIIKDPEDGFPDEKCV